MDTAQINSPRFSYQTAAPAAPRTLNDMRIIPDYHDPVSTFSAKKAMLPALITALIVVGIAGTAIGLHRYSENTTEKLNATIDTSTPIVAPAPAPVAKDAVTEPLGPVIKSEEVAPPVVTQKTEVAKPVAKPRAVAPKAAPAPAAMESTPPAREAAPPSPPVAEPVVIPPPAPVVEPAPTTPPEPPKQ